MYFKRRLLLTLSFLLIGLKGFSQAIPAIDSLRTFKQYKLNLEFLGVSFERESPISRRNTFLLHAELAYTFQLTGGNIFPKYSYSLAPLFFVGSRHYYRLYPSSLRLKKNIGNFIGINSGIQTIPILSKNYSSSSVAFLYPYWGIQRRLGQWGSFEVGLGIGIHAIIGAPIDYFYVAPNLQLRAGIFL